MCTGCGKCSKQSEQAINAEYLTLLNQSISVLLQQYLGGSDDLSYLPSIEDEPTDFARSLSRIFSQLEKVRQWAADRVAYLNSLAGLDNKTKEQVLWGLSPCPLSLVELAQLLQQLNVLVPDDIGRSYIPSLLLGVAETLGNLLHNAMYLIALHSRATNQTGQAMPTKEEIWQSLQEAVSRCTRS